MSSTGVMFMSKTIGTCVFPEYWQYWLTYYFAIEDPVTPSVSIFNLFRSTGETLKWKLTNGNWIGGEEEAQYTISNEFSEELIKILQFFNYN